MTTQEQLACLSGMAYAQGKYSPAEWESKVGVNPILLPKYISIRNDKCYWTVIAEETANIHFDQVKNNFSALGISCN